MGPFHKYILEDGHQVIITVTMYVHAISTKEKLSIYRYFLPEDLVVLNVYT